MKQVAFSGTVARRAVRVNQKVLGIALLAVLIGCSAHSPAYRGAKYGDMLPGQEAKAAYDAFVADRSPQIRGRFNESSCSECHGIPTAGGSQVLQQDFVIKQAGARGSGVTFPRYALVHGLVAFRYPQGHYALRRPQPLYGVGFFESVPRPELEAIVADQRMHAPQHAGRIAILTDGSVGRFGWKASTPSLRAFVETAFATELGVPHSKDIPKVTRYLQLLAAPPRLGSNVHQGRMLFDFIGCADCHRPQLRTPDGTIDPYTDLLLHDMGAAMASFPEGAASASEYRTAPLWGIARTGSPFLHDGRAHSLAEAIELHGGQAADSAAAFDMLSQSDRAALLRFLKSL